MQKFIEECPIFMQKDLFTLEFPLSKHKRDRVWESLQQRETFTQGQIFPYRVEFETGKEHGPFDSGEKNIHHGPLLHLPGEIGNVTDDYRSLFYYFGSYVISFRLVRPACLEFFKTDKGIKLSLKSFVKPSFGFLWRFGNKIFWKFFGITFLFTNT